MKILCVISARGGSQGLKNKNLINFFGKPLICWSIKQAMKSKVVKEVYVSTDSSNIAKFCKSQGAIIPFIRNKKLATSNASKFLTWKDSLKRIEKINKTKYDYFFDLDCTNPLRSPEDIRSFVNTSIKKINNFIDGVITVTKARKNPYFNMLELNKKKLLVLSKKKSKNPVSRQQAPLVFDQVASMYFFKTNFIRNNNALYQGKLVGFTLKEYQNFDIDSKIDYKVVKTLFKTYYLKKQCTI